MTQKQEQFDKWVEGITGPQELNTTTIDVKELIYNTGLTTEIVTEWLAAEPPSETLEDLLRTKITTVINNQEVEFEPEFKVAVQEVEEQGVRITIYANGPDSDTLDFYVAGNTLKKLGNVKGCLD